MHLDSLPRVRAAAAAAMLATGTLAGTSAAAETIFGLTATNALVYFDSSTPTFSSAPVPVSGLNTGATLLGIDLRPSNGQLYGLSSDGNLYTLNRFTGQATFASVLSSGLSGSVFGVDFNPVPDRLRITSNTGQNLRVNVDDGATTVDGALNGPTTNITGAAYSNNDNDPATGTTLYTISGATASLYRQDPPNAGTQVFVGALGVGTTEAVGFDISGATAAAYASLTDQATGASSLYTIDLSTGAATSLGAFGFGGVALGAPALLDIAVAPVPEPETYAMLAAGLAVVAGIVRRRRKSAR